MKRTLPLLLLVSLIPVAGCAMQDWGGHSFEGPLAAAKESPTLGEATEVHRLSADAEPMPFLSVVHPRKVVYVGEFEVVVGNLRSSIGGAKALAEKMGGYVQRMTQNAIVFRVPAEKFYQAVDALEAMGTVTHRNITAQDVTEQYIDLEIRLKNARALLEELRALLKKAQNVKDALAVESELARVRAEVERMQGRFNSLANRVSYATLSVSFVQIGDAPQRLKISLPFYWLKTLGLDNLLAFDR